jgi:hypothetical protein
MELISDVYMNALFGPLTKKYCTYFYLLSMFFFVASALSAVSMVLFSLKNGNQMTFERFSNAMFMFTSLFFNYFINRIMYSMCVGSL